MVRLVIPNDLAISATVIPFARAPLGFGRSPLPPLVAALSFDNLAGRSPWH